MKALALITAVVAALVSCGGSTPASPSTDIPLVETSLLETTTGVLEAAPVGSSTIATPETTVASVVVGPVLDTQSPVPVTTIDPIFEQIMTGLPMPPLSTVDLPIPPMVPPSLYNPPITPP